MENYERSPIIPMTEEQKKDFELQIKKLDRRIEIMDKIKETGYDGLIDGETFYDEICDEIEDKEVGSYLFMSKRDNGDIFEYKVDVMEDQFNLSYVTITSGDRSFHADFD